MPITDKRSFFLMWRGILLGLLGLALGVSTSQGQSNWDPNLRPVSLVSRTDTEMTLDNVRWGMTFNGNDFQTIFKRTKICPGLVKEVYYCVEAFPPKFIADHALIIFVFSSLDGVVATDNSKDIGLAISVTNRTRQTDTGSRLLKSFMPRRAKDPWPILYEVGTFKDRLHTSLVKLERTMRLHRLDVSQPMKEAILRAGLELSLMDHSREWYHLLQNNCIVHAVKIIQQGLKDSLDLEMWNFRNMLLNPYVALPKLSMSHLLRKKLVSRVPWVIKPSQETVLVPTLPTEQYAVRPREFPGFLSAPAGLLPFAQGVRAFQERELMFDDVKKLQLLMGVTDPRYPQTLRLANQINDEQETIWSSLLQAVHRKPEELMKQYVVWLDHPANAKDGSLKRLNAMFLESLQFKITRDRSGERKKAWEPLIEALRRHAK